MVVLVLLPLLHQAALLSRNGSGDGSGDFDDAGDCDGASDYDVDGGLVAIMLLPLPAACFSRLRRT